MTKANKKTIIAILTIIMLIAINTIALAASSYSANVSLTSDSKLKEGDTVTINVNLTSVNAGNSVPALTAQIDYDTSVFETLTASDLKSTTGWTPSFSTKNNGISAMKNEAVTSAETMFTITLKVKSSISVDSTKVTLKNIVYSGGVTTGDITVNDAIVTLSKDKSGQSTTGETKNDDITISKNNNVASSSSSKNTKVQDSTTSKKNLPKTGLQEYGFVAILVVAIIGVFSYSVYKRISRDVK